MQVSRSATALLLTLLVGSPAPFAAGIVYRVDTSGFTIVNSNLFVPDVPPSLRRQGFDVGSGSVPVSAALPEQGAARTTNTPQRQHDGSGSFDARGTADRGRLTASLTVSAEQTTSPGPIGGSGTSANAQVDVSVTTDDFRLEPIPNAVEQLSPEDLEEFLEILESGMVPVQVKNLKVDRMIKSQGTVSGTGGILSAVASVRMDMWFPGVALAGDVFQGTEGVTLETISGNVVEQPFVGGHFVDPPELVLVPLLERIQLVMLLRLRGGVSAARRNASGSLTIDAARSFSFPSDGPVFELPPGFTANSPLLGIVDNRWVGPIIPEPSTATLTLLGGLIVCSRHRRGATGFASRGHCSVVSQIGGPSPVSLATLVEDSRPHVRCPNATC